MAHDAIEIEEGKYLAVGYSDATLTHIGGGMFVLKLDNEGNLIGTKVYNHYPSDWRHAITRVEEGGFALVGSMDSTTPSMFGIHTIYINNIGEIMWERTIYRPEFNFGLDITTSSDGGIVITGECEYHGEPYGRSKLLLAKFDLEGNILWQYVYGPENCRLHYPKVKQDNDRGFICISPKWNVSPLWGREFFLLKTNAVGESLWARTYSFDGDYLCAFMCDVAPTFDGGYIVTGIWDWDLFIMKLDSIGGIIWRKVYGIYTINEAGHSILQLPDSGYAVAGITNAPSNTKGWLLRFDSSGDTLWTRIFGGTDRTVFYSISATSDKGFLMAGVIMHADPFDSYDIWVVKTDSLGYTTIEERFPQKPKNVSISTYPNPFNSSVRISLNIEQQGAEASCSQPVIEIFDISGRKVAQLGSAPFGSAQGAVSRSSSDGCQAESRQAETRSLSEVETTTPREFLWQPDETVGSGVYLVRATLSGNEGFQPLVQTKRIVFLK